MVDFNAGQIPTAEELTSLDMQGAYTPVLTGSTTNPNLGEDGIAQGAWHRSGLLIVGWARFLFSGTGLDAGNGIYRISPPFAVDSSIIFVAGAGAAGFTVGVGRLRDDNAGANSVDVTVQFSGPTALQMAQEETNAAVNEGNPIVWAEGDRISINFQYIADPGEF